MAEGVALQAEGVAGEAVDVGRHGASTRRAMRVAAIHDDVRVRSVSIVPAGEELPVTASLAQRFRHALVAFQPAGARVTLSDRDRVER